MNIWLNHHPCDVKPLPMMLMEDLHLFTSLPQNNVTLQLIPIDEHVQIIKIGKKSIQDELKYRHLSIPFVSESSAWGIGVNETAIQVNAWLPRLGPPSSLPFGANFRIVYTHVDVSMYLEYEEDEEGAEEFSDEFDKSCIFIN